MIPKQAVFLFFKASAQNMQIPLDNLKSSLRDRIDLLIKIGFGVAVAIGCYFVVAPFATAILISAMLCVVTWPFLSGSTPCSGTGERCPLFSWSHFLP